MLFQWLWLETYHKELKRMLWNTMACYRMLRIANKFYGMLRNNMGRNTKEYLGILLNAKGCNGMLRNSMEY